MADLTGIGTILGSGVGLLDAIVGTVFSGMNYQSQQEQNELTKDMMYAQGSQMFDTIALRDDYDSYAQSYLHQVHQGKWQDRLNKQDLLSMVQMDREDNAIQRKVADAKKSGVNPFYALGGTGSQASTYTSGNSNVQLPAPKFDQIQGLSNLANLLSNVEVKREQANLLKAQTEKTEAETGKIGIDTLVSSETLNLTKAQADKVRKEIDLLREQINVEQVKYEKFMEEVAIMQYDLMKSVELGVRYKDVLTTFSFMINKLDSIAGDITANEKSKDLLLTIGATLLGATAVGKGVKVGKFLAPYIKKYGDKVKGRAKELFNLIKPKKKSSSDTNTSDFFG